MKFMKYIIESLGYTFGAVLWSMTSYVYISDLPNFINMSKFEFTLKNGLVISLAVFILLLITFGAISFTIKSIQSLFLAFYYGLFHNPKYSKMNITVDENNMIRESFIEFKNGDRLPIEITKVIANIPKEEVKENYNE